MSFQEFRDKHKSKLRFLLIVILCLVFVSHIYQYSHLMRYENVNTGETITQEGLNKVEGYYLDGYAPALNTSATYDFSIEPNQIIVDYDLATKRDNVLFQMMIDLFVLSLLYPKKSEDEKTA